MSNKRKRIKTDNQATSRVYTEVEYQALKDEIVQLKQAVDEHCDREREWIDEQTAHKDISQLLVTKQWSDLTINVGGKDFAVHRAILSARSPIVADLVEANRMRNHLVINDVSVGAFEALLSFIYTGKVPTLELKLAKDLLVAADKYRLEPLKSTTEEYLCSQVSVESVASLHSLAEAVNASKLKDKCIKLFYSLTSSSMTRRLSAPVSRLDDPCLVALFKQLPLADKITARKVCQRWADLVLKATQSTRTLTIFMGDRAMNEYGDWINFYSLGSIKVVSLLKKRNGSPMYPLARFNQWKALQYRGEGLDEATVEAIVATFVNIKRLRIALDPVSFSQLDSISYLLELYAHQLTTLKLYEDVRRPNDRFFAAINGLYRLKNLHLYLLSLPYRDLPVISQLEHLRVHWDNCSPHQFIALLRQYTTTSISLRTVEYISPHSPNYSMSLLTSLGDHLLTRFTRLGLNWTPLGNPELICAQFCNLTSLSIHSFTNGYSFGDGYRHFFGHLSKLTQLLHLSLHINLKFDEWHSCLYFGKTDQPYPQLKSVRAFELYPTIRKHNELEQLKLDRTMPNLQVIYFDLWLDSRCIDCNIEKFNAHHLKANIPAARHCFRQMLAPVKANCSQLRAILHNREEILGSAEEIFAE